MNETNEPIKEEVKVRLFPEDLMKYAKEQAFLQQEYTQLKAKLSEIQKSMNTQLSAHTNRLNELSAKINQGYEMREVDCMWIMDMPRSGSKTLVRVDDNEEVRVEAMTQADAQLGINLQPAPEDQSAGDEQAQPPEARDEDEKED